MGNLPEHARAMNKLAFATAIVATMLAPAAQTANAAIAKPARVVVHFNPKTITARDVSGEAGSTGRAVTADDPVRVASISKLVGALAAMRLVDQKKIDLDRDISDYLGWRVRNPAFPDVPITMRQLLTHRTGIRDNIDYILPLDGRLETVLSNPAAWEAKYPPGSYFSYANLNSPIIAATMEAVTGKRFDIIVAELILKPLKIDGCFNWGAGCSAGRRAQAVTLLRANGDLARDPVTPGSDPCPITPAKNGGCDLRHYALGKNGSSFSPQGGLRISPIGLAKIGQVLLNGGKPILSRKAFAEMTHEQWRFDGKNGDDEKGYFLRYGLGIHMHKDANGVEWIGHVGEAYALRAGFWINPAGKGGKVQYVTMVPEEAPVGHCLDTCP
jgi:CubicO group peptidase (beta-lactamase class C family)